MRQFYGQGEREWPSYLAKGALTFFLISCCFVSATAQLGLNPPSTKWKEIKTKDIQVIFPIDREAEAQRVANMLTEIKATENSTLGNETKRIPIILHQNTVVPNGFVSILPWRSEFYLTPPQQQFAGTIDWLDLLTIHEYRHAQQMATARKGWPSRLLYALSGHNGWSFMVGAVQPRWFLEGDAVFAETVNSESGRGRTPTFEMGYRALRLDQRYYNYEKASAFSLKDFIPDHYRQGYFMTSYARRKFGADIWDKVLEDCYSTLRLGYGFSKALKKNTGLSTKELYYHAMADLDDIWGIQDLELAYSPSETVETERKRTFTNYRYPHFLSDGSILTWKQGFDQINTVVKINPDGIEHKLFEPGFTVNPNISVSSDKNRVTWSEIRFNERWANQSYSIIKYYDLTTGKKRTLTRKTKYFSPAFSPDDKKLAVVEVDDKGSSKIVVLNAETGTELQRIDNPDNAFLSFPKWSDDGEVVAVAKKDGFNTIRAFNLENGKHSDLIPFTNDPIDRITAHGSKVYFSGAQGGINNIFYVESNSKDIFQLTVSRIGAFDPVISEDGKTLLYSEYTSDGYELATAELSKLKSKKYENDKNMATDYYKLAIEKEPFQVHGKNDSVEFSTKKFNPLLRGLFNVHSWYPVLSDTQFGVGVFSQNVMSTLSASAQVNYNTNEDGFQSLTTISYGGLYPIIDLQFKTADRETDVLAQSTDSSTVVAYNGAWTEDGYSAGIRLPFNLTSGNHSTSLTVGSMYHYYKIDYRDVITDLSREGNFDAISTSLRFSRIKSAARQHINPRFGQILRTSYQKAISGNSDGQMFNASLVLFFPGFDRNHSFYVSGAYQEEDLVDAYRFTNTFSYPRGYGERLFENIYRLSANYSLPLVYPDLSVGSVFFIRRLRLNTFYDYARGEILGLKSNLHSAGIELNTEFRFFRLTNVDLGIRAGGRWGLGGSAENGFVQVFLGKAIF